MTRLDRHSEANAAALYGRERTYSAASDASFRIKWDASKREPRDLREAVRLVRAAYADEVPTKLHDHLIGEGGTPKMTDAALRYLDQPHAADNREEGLISFHLTPFRAAHARMGKTLSSRIVWRVATGTGPVDAALRVGVPREFAKLVAEDVLRAFCRSLSDIKLDLHKEPEAA